MEYRTLSTQELVEKLDEYGKRVNEMNQKLPMHGGILNVLGDDLFIKTWNSFDDSRYYIVGDMEELNILQERVKRLGLK